MDSHVHTRREWEGIMRPYIQVQQVRGRKIPKERRRKKFIPNASLPWFTQIGERFTHDTQFFRSTVQGAFALLCILIGIEFHLFVRWGISGGAHGYYDRPPGVEGFLPISAVMGLKQWIDTGILNTIHPAGTLILLAIILVSVILKKSFCSWLCPIGTLSESLWMLGQNLFKRNFTVPRWLDYPLRSLKYILLFFFVYSIWQMSTEDLGLFINSPYNKVADIKMYLFFAGISEFALWTIICLLVLSVFIQNFWCRYLCPYGALLGLFGFLSPVRITRSASSCIDCGLCARACPSRIAVDTVTQVWSDECTSCMRCVEECPVKDTLVLRLRKNSTAVPTWLMGTLVAGVFIAVTGLGILTNHWHNSISREEYLTRFQHIDSPVYNHNRGHVPQYGPND